MQNPFSQRPLEEQGTLGRLLGRAHPENAWIAVENVLATNDWNAINASHIAAALQEHGVEEVDREKAKELYAQAVRSFLKDDEVSDAEAAGLERLRALLSLSDSELAELQQTLIEPYYQQQIANALADHQVTDDEREHLRRLRTALRINERFALDALQTAGSRLLDTKWVAAMDDRRLSDDEVKALEAMAANFGLRATFGAGRDPKVDRFRWMWLIENGTFPEIKCEAHLLPGEICHWATGAALLSLETETTGFNYTQVDTTLFRGMRYRSGTVDIKPVEKTAIKEVDRGVLYVTDRRLFLQCAQGQRGTPWDVLTSVTPYNGMIAVHRNDNRSILFRLEDVEYAAVLISARILRVLYGGAAAR